MRLRELIGDIGAKYDRRLPMSSEAQMLLRQARVEFEQFMPAGFRADGGGGKGRAAVTPRIAIVKTDESATTRRGIYVAYLFAADMSTVTLTLNQGVAEIAETLGRPAARRTVAWDAAEVRASFRRDDIADLDTTIDLRSKAPLSVDYQHGNILARTYKLTALPSERAMLADLHRFLRLYATALSTRAGRQSLAQSAAPPALARDDGGREPSAADLAPSHDDGPPPIPAGRGRTTVLTRRGLFVALAAMPAVVITRGALGGEPVTEPKPPLPDTAPRFTVDVSQHDWNLRGGNLDWETVRNGGIVGMCARATYGDPYGWHYPSFHFGDFVRGAKAAGLLVRGGYHNLIRGDQDSINRQVDWLRRELDAYDANWAMLDIERYAELVSANLWPRWDDVRRFDDRWAAVDDRVLVGYLPPWNWNKHLGRPDLRGFRGPLIASNYPLKYNSADYRQLYAHCGGAKGSGWASYGNRMPDGWQFSSRARVPGAASICDINAWRMTFDQLSALLTVKT